MNEINAMIPAAHAATTAPCQNRKSISYGSELETARMMSVSAGIASTASVPTKAWRNVLNALRAESGSFTSFRSFRFVVTPYSASKQDDEKNDDENQEKCSAPDKHRYRSFRDSARMTRPSVSTSKHRAFSTEFTRME